MINGINILVRETRMKIKVINGRTGNVYHETEKILDASHSVAWLIPSEFMTEKEIIITVNTPNQHTKQKCYQCDMEYVVDPENQYHVLGYCGFVCWGIDNDLC